MSEPLLTWIGLLLVFWWAYRVERRFQDVWRWNKHLEGLGHEAHNRLDKVEGRR